MRLLPIYQKIFVYRLKHKKEINVVFFAMSLSMWRYQHLYELLNKNSKFKVTIVILPCLTYSPQQQENDEKELIRYFELRGLPYILGKNGREYINLRKTLNPDLLFYPQPYNGYYPKSLSYNTFYDRLLCYYPYAFWTSKDEWSYNQPLHKAAWKLFYSTQVHLDEARQLAFRGDKNVEVVGYPNADDFLFRKHTDVWKSQIDNKTKKRLIWAPHFTITSGGPLYQSNFLWMSEVMKDIAIRYKEDIQITFKPHPRLFSELCVHPDWGLYKTSEYYDFWAKTENTQYENGTFVDLFMTSDAMIHDSSSFCVEYLYARKPVLYIAKDYERQYDEKNSLGKLALSNHYVGRNKKEILDFIDNMVLGGYDPIKSQRDEFVDTYLIPPKNHSVAQNTMDILLQELS